MQSAKSDLSNGGYFADGETFDKGKLDNCDINLNGVSQSISGIMNKSGKKILDLEEKIREYKRLYEQANIDYNNACLLEKDD